MKVILDETEKQKVFHDCLCNIVCGSNYFAGYGIELVYREEDYRRAKADLVFEGKTGICIEDVLMNMLQLNFQISFRDNEGDNSKRIRWSELEWNPEKASSSFYLSLISILDETSDASDNDNVLQTLLYGDIIYG